MAPRHLCHNLWHKVWTVPPSFGHGTHVLKVPRRPALLIGELPAKIRSQARNDLAAPPEPFLPVEDLFAQ